MAFSRPMWRQHVAAGATCALLAAFTYWAVVIDRRPPLEFVSGEITPARVNLSEGGLYQPVWHLKIWRKCDGTTYRRIVDGRRVVHIIEPQPTLAARLAPRFAGDIVRVAGRPQGLPLAAAPGSALFIASIEFTGCAWWHTHWPIVVHLPELPFEIVR